MGLSKDESIAQFGSDKWTGWGQTEATANAKALGVLDANGKLAAPNLDASSVNSSSGLTTYLDDYQKTLMESLQTQLDNVPSTAEIVASITPKTAAPTPINRVQLLEEQKTKYGVTDLETQLNDLKAQEATINADLRTVTGAETDKPVALNVMSGRMTEEQRQAQVKLDYLNVQKSVLNDRLTTAYNAINTYINYAGLDYNDAKAAYDTEFSQNLQIQNLLSSNRTELFSATKAVLDEATTIKQNAIDNARANLTTIANAITSGNVNMADLSDDEKLQIQKLEIQSGLPVGIIAAMKEKVDPKANIVFTTSNNGVTQVGFRNSDGTISVQSYGKDTSKPSSTETKAAAINQIKAAAQAGESFSDILKVYSGELDANDIYSTYNASSKWGPVQIGTDKVNQQYTKEELTALGITLGNTNNTQPIINIGK